MSISFPWEKNGIQYLKIKLKKSLFKGNNSDENANIDFFARVCREWPPLL